MEKQLIEEISDGVATLTFNRPDRLNALSTPIMEGLLEPLPRLARDAAVGVMGRRVPNMQVAVVNPAIRAEIIGRREDCDAKRSSVPERLADYERWLDRRRDHRDL